MPAARWVLPVALAAFAASARADGPAYETVVHARPRREKGTTLVLTGRELVERGVDNLSEALDLLPEVVVRQGGNGQMRVDLRGAKQREMLILIDGVPVDEPWLGSFDLASIPVTDIVEIRVTLAPASPLEGPGGDGGIIEVSTLRATGNKRIAARVRASSVPDGLAAVSGRTPLPDDLALRASVGGRYGSAPYQVTAPDGSPATFDDKTGQVHAGLRLVKRLKNAQVTADAWYQHRTYFIPPTDSQAAQLQDITGEDAVRAVVGAEIDRGPVRLALGAYSSLLSRASEYYADYTETKHLGHEDLLADRAGAAAHLDWALSRGELHALVSARLSFDFEWAKDAFAGQTPGTGNDTFFEPAVGAEVTWRWLKLDAAAGGGIPFGQPSSSWPEGKLQISFTPHPILDIRLVAARKGRVPTLRELYEPLDGNAQLTPEQNTYAEVQIDLHVRRWATARLTGYYRYAEGLIRLDPETHTHFVNLDALSVHGLEAVVELFRGRPLGGGLAYIYGEASSRTLGLDPIDNFPRHRVEAWIEALWRGHAGGTLRVRWVGDRTDQGQTLASYTYVEVSGWARLSRRLKATLRVENLTDERYLLRAGVEALPPSVALSLDGVWE